MWMAARNEEDNWNNSYIAGPSTSEGDVWRAANIASGDDPFLMVRKDRFGAILEQYWSDDEV